MLILFSHEHEGQFLTNSAQGIKQLILRQLEDVRRKRGSVYKQERGVTYRGVKPRTPEDEAGVSATIKRHPLVNDDIAETTRINHKNYRNKCDLELTLPSKM
jgi:hypothetical protein